MTISFPRMGGNEPAPKPEMNKLDSLLKQNVDNQLIAIQKLQATIAEKLVNIRKVEIQGIKFSHKGSTNKSFNINANTDLNNNTMMKDKGNAHLENVENYHIQFERINFSTQSDSVIMIKTGEVLLKQCLINLNLLMRESQRVTPAVVVDSGTTVSLDQCNFRGSSNYNTLGVVVRNANLIMKSTIVSGFLSGGIMLYAKPDNIIKIYKSNIRSNKFFGI